MVKKQIVYLAGGFRSNWRKKVKNTCTNLLFIDPEEKEQNKKFTPSEYGCWDLHFVKQSDIVFVYMAKNNPSGYGLSVEIGYAKALGKTVILVLEKEHEKYRYLKFLESVADVVYENLDESITFLSSF
jgi:nucleoside 2-deoxyribosyltransferase